MATAYAVGDGIGPWERRERGNLALLHLLRRRVTAALVDPVVSGDWEPLPDLAARAHAD